MPEDIAGSEQMLANWNQKIQERAARYQEMATRVQGMTISERSSDGSIEILVGSNGILQNLVIAESASGKRMSEVSGEIMRLLQRAQSRIPELLQEAMAETIGTQDETANVLFNEAKKNFPAPPAEEPARTPYDRNEINFRVEEDAPPPSRPAPPPPPPRRRRPSDDDDDFGGESVLS
ncbi:YbaB/EbfC family nucleoid-associated protein [Lentzea sp. NEAU-D7]|uniref:YbaB/EbfC family nucleoid-associated protein n=1 Tax=Lentzea sp. NEAU-D7 TaxID=2994667 RepID=UPI00224AF594|nr:YbaB/EbfC family nucleoid-associated protein [Lentzea sp. NEAU-D7]MCX2953037.1 YbaB/EbfC family nucleoid-associated protein [Lentzea sp. NEAU-D7]